MEVDMLVRATASLVVMFALAGATIGCNAAGADDSSVAVTVDSSRGYPVVRSSGDPTAWTTELVATMGIDSAGLSMFGTVRSVLLDSSGAGYVLDPSYRQIHVFEADGRFREVWGRQGNGPGEFSSPYSIAWLGDSMAVLDPSNARLMLLDDEGRWARQWPAE
ncbi:MAG TPA: 6-bladed beta-propeller, partial [Gemmatimonadaceae bacterium]|nr:6-bladed beta-propeller [Gemmatimonadaceae bacterium]